MQIASTTFVQLGISSKNCCSHSASLSHLSKATDSDFIMDLVIIVCFKDFHDIAASPKVNTYPLVALESCVLDIQLSSEYHSKTAGSIM